MRKFRTVCVVAVLGLLAIGPVQALTINPIYDASITNLPNAATIQGAFATAAQLFQNTYTDPITINIMVYLGANGPFSANPSGGASYGNYMTGYAYNTMYTALTNDAKSTFDFTSIGSGTVPAANPAPFATYMLPSAEAKALNIGFSYTNSFWTNFPAAGFTGATNNIDGWVSFNSNTNQWFFNQASPVSNQFDFVGTAEHEISEVLGRITQINQTNFFPYTLPFDLFRYTNTAARNFSTNAANVYFTINNGTNSLLTYNGPGGGDLADWNGATLDAYNAFLTNGVAMPVSLTDVITLDVIGYDLAVPEPSALLLFSAGVGMIAYVRRRRQRTG